MFYGGVMTVVFLVTAPLLMLFGLSPKDLFDLEITKKDP